MKPTAPTISSSTAFALTLLAGCGAPDEYQSLTEALTCNGESCSTVERQSCAADSDFDCSVTPKYPCDTTRATSRVTCTDTFPVAGTGHVIQDSLGTTLGTLTATRVHLNYGVRRTGVNGAAKVMAWSAPTTGGTVTGWLNESAIDEDLSFMPNAIPADPHPTSYSDWHIVASNNAPYLDSAGNSLKVVADTTVCNSTGGMNATDYLGRNGRVNIIWNLPGHGFGSPTTDVYPNSGTRIVFHRAPNVVSVDVPLYDCTNRSADNTPRRATQTLKFLYGYIQVADGKKRLGWMAYPNLGTGS